jgi:oligopeptide transport system substrate-binding protein
MWRATLGIETEIVTKNWDEYETAVRAGDYDIVRRSVVMQTMDEATNLRAIFDPHEEATAVAPDSSQPTAESSPAASPEQPVRNQTEMENKNATAQVTPPPPVMSEAQALKELPAVPIYFASSYALVKPYIAGFDTNLLDAPSLKTVRIDTSWQPPRKNNASWLAP